jgi:hypothetical protein
MPADDEHDPTGGHFMPVETPSIFAQVIKEHLDLKERNSRLGGAMPIDHYKDGDPFENHPLFKSEEQARIEETMDGVEPDFSDTSLEDVGVWPGEESIEVTAETREVAVPAIEQSASGAPRRARLRLGRHSLAGACTRSRTTELAFARRGLANAPCSLGLTGLGEIGRALRAAEAARVASGCQLALRLSLGLPLRGSGCLEHAPRGEASEWVFTRTRDSRTWPRTDASSVRCGPLLGASNVHLNCDRLGDRW